MTFNINIYETKGKPTLKASTFAIRTSQRTDQKLQKSLLCQRRKPYRMKEHRSDNSGFAKKRVQWLIEHSTSHQHLWYVDSFVLRNPPLRQAPNRYMPLYDNRNV